MRDTYVDVENTQSVLNSYVNSITYLSFTQHLVSSANVFFRSGKVENSYDFRLSNFVQLGQTQYYVEQETDENNELSLENGNM